MAYDLYCPFDMQKHKETYTNYLEVILFPDGVIEYAVPSHQEKLIKVCCDKLNVSREELFKLCPEDYYFDVITWLCNISGCVSIWNNGLTKSDCNPLTEEQVNKIKELQKEKLYTGGF